MVVSAKKQFAMYNVGHPVNEIAELVYHSNNCMVYDTYIASYSYSFHGVYTLYTNLYLGAPLAR